MQGIIARAFEIARSGDCKTLREMETMLSKEGYEKAGSHLHGYQFRRQMLKTMREADTPARVSSEHNDIASLGHPA